MAVDLSDYTASLTRAVTPLGGAVSTTVTSSMLVGYLADAFWEAKLDGFLKGFTCDEDGLVQALASDGEVQTPAEELANPLPDVAREQVSVIVLYAAIGILQRQVLNTQTQFRAKAGPVEFEQQSSATMLAEMLKQLAAQKTRLLALADEEGSIEASGILMRDVVADRLYGHSAYAAVGY